MLLLRWLGIWQDVRILGGTDHLQCLASAVQVQWRSDESFSCPSHLPSLSDLLYLPACAYLLRNHATLSCDSTLPYDYDMRLYHQNTFPHACDCCRAVRWFASYRSATSYSFPALMLGVTSLILTLTKYQSLQFTFRVTRNAGIVQLPSTLLLSRQLNPTIMGAAMPSSE